MKTRIGEILVRTGLVTESQLARALQVQNAVGGRTGTLLLEGGVLGEEDLGETLAVQHHCAYVPWNTLSALPPETLAVVPARLALKHNAIPYELGEGYVKMALRDPDDLGALDELGFSTGRRVIANVAPEVRIYQALEKHYGKLRAARYAILAERLSRSRKAAARRASGPPPPPDLFEQRPAAPAVSEPSPKPPTPPTPVALTPFLAPPPEPERPGEPEGIPWDDTTGSKSRPKPANSNPPPMPFEEAKAFEFADFETHEKPLRESPPPPVREAFDQVLDATGRDAIAEAVLAALVRRFPSAAIFSSRSDGVTGWAAAGKGVNPSALRSFSVSWKEPSVFLKARLSRNYYLGPLPSLPHHDQLADALGGWQNEGIVQAVFIGETPVAFLYASCPSSGSFSVSDLAFVGALREAASAALANAIRLKKGEI